MIPNIHHGGHLTILNIKCCDNKRHSRGTQHNWLNDTCLHLGFHCLMRLVACYTSANTLAPSNNCQWFQTEFCNHAPGWFFHRYTLKESICLKAGDHFIKMSPFLSCLWPWNEHHLTSPQLICIGDLKSTTSWQYVIVAKTCVVDKLYSVCNLSNPAPLISVFTFF